MKSDEERRVDKKHYEKPTAVDLGHAAPVVGASCVDGGQIDINGFCAVWGNGARGCGFGNNA